MSWQTGVMAVTLMVSIVGCASSSKEPRIMWPEYSLRSMQFEEAGLEEKVDDANE